MRKIPFPAKKKFSKELRGEVQLLCKYVQMYACSACLEEFRILEGKYVICKKTPIKSVSSSARTRCFYRGGFGNWVPKIEIETEIYRGD